MSGTWNAKFWQNSKIFPCLLAKHPYKNSVLKTFTQINSFLRQSAIEKNCREVVAKMFWNGECLNVCEHKIPVLFEDPCKFILWKEGLYKYELRLMCDSNYSTTSVITCPQHQILLVLSTTISPLYFDLFLEDDPELWLQYGLHTTRFNNELLQVDSSPFHWSDKETSLSSIQKTKPAVMMVRSIPLSMISYKTFNGR